MFCCLADQISKEERGSPLLCLLRETYQQSTVSLQKKQPAPVVAKGKRRRLNEIASPTDLLAAYNAGLAKKCMKRKEEQEELVVAGYVGMRQTNEWSGGRTGLRNLGNRCHVASLSLVLDRVTCRACVAFSCGCACVVACV